VRVAIAESAHHRPRYLAVNPRGLVPALEYEGRTDTENIAILTLLGQLHPGSGLLPLDDDFALARFYERLSFFATSVHTGGFGRIFRAVRTGPWPRPDAATRAYDRQLLDAHFVEIEALLSDGEWLLGDRYTAADAYPLTFIRWARRQQFDVAGYPHWQAHARRMLGRPAVLRAIATEGLEAAEF
jgi:glutathione S-transferase